MKANLNEIEINGDVYVKKGSEVNIAPPTDGMRYCAVRTYDGNGCL